jgi:vitamin B12 transporter
MGRRHRSSQKTCLCDKTQFCFRVKSKEWKVHAFYFYPFFRKQSHKTFFVMKKFFVVAALIPSSSLMAQHAADSTKQLDEVVVTANKFPKNLNETGKVVTVINREILERNTGRTVGDVLSQQAGFRVVGAQNNLGTNQDVYLRGAGLGKTLILIDGVPAYDPAGIVGAFDLNTIAIDNIERIEVVKGALSTLYGSDAIAGVVNIITRKSSQGRPVAFNGTLAGGSYGTFKGSANLSGQQAGTAYALGYTRLSASNGFSSAYDSTGKGNFDNDRFGQDVLNASLTTAIAPKLSLRLYGQYSAYMTEADASAFQDDKDFVINTRNYIAGANATWQYGKNTLYVNYSYGALNRHYVDESQYGTTNQDYSGRAHFAEAYTRIAAGKYLDVLAGADLRLQKTDQSYVSPFFSSYLGQDSASSELYSAFASLILKPVSGFNAELGGRFNQHSTYGNNFTYSFNPSYRIGHEVKLFANLASGFKAPTLYQIASGPADRSQLKAESSITFDGGVQYEPMTDMMFRAVYFLRNIKNGIDYNGFTNSYFNYNRQKDHGFELEGTAKSGHFFGSLNYTFVTGNVNTVKYKDPANYDFRIIGDTVFNNLFRRPKHSANLTIGYQPREAFMVSATARYTGERDEFQYAAAPVLLNEYVTMDLYAEYRVRPAIKIFADLRNISNERFTEIYGYNSRRFNFMAGLSYSFR